MSEDIGLVVDGNPEKITAAIIRTAHDEGRECALKLGFAAGPALLNDVRREADWWKEHVGLCDAPCTPELARAISVDLIAVLLDMAHFIEESAGDNSIGYGAEMVDAYLDMLRLAAPIASRTAPDMNCPCNEARRREHCKPIGRNQPQAQPKAGR